MILRGGSIELEHEEAALLDLACSGGERPALDADLFSAWLEQPVSDDILAIHWGGAARAAQALRGGAICLP